MMQPYYKKNIKLLFMVFIILMTSNTTIAGKIDWAKIRKTKDKTFIEYVRSLNLRGQAALDFWKRLPLSKANEGINKIFRKEAFAIYLNKYPRSKGKVPEFKVGSGTTAIGPMSGQSLKLPFSNYYPLKKGTIGDPKKIYKIGYTIHGFKHPWLLNNADSAIWEANKHSNVKLTVLDPAFDNKKQVAQIDNWIKEKFDGILIWPMQEAPTGPPVDRAYKNKIPSVSVDRLVGSSKVRVRVTGNFPANGTQQGMYLIHRLLKEEGSVKANVLMIRKPLGSTADAIRTGHFLKVMSYFPGIKILDSYHNSSSRQESERQVGQALKKYPEIDVIFCTGAEQSMGAVQALDKAKKWSSRTGDKKIIILNNDDLFEALKAIKSDKIAMTAPYTPLLGGLGVRVLLKAITGEKVPRDVVTPDLPMITKTKENIFGIETITVDEWIPYSYGRD
jgi:ABC-type sugar transport system substrate-binding protein